MSQITRQMLTAFRADLDKLLDGSGLRAKYGLSSLKSGRCSFDPQAGTFSMKVESVMQGAMGKEAALYENSAFLGLPALGFEFTERGRKFKTSGLNTTGSKVVCERDDGQKFLVPVETVKRFAAKGVPSKPAALDADTRAAFQRLANALSPENLTCDGELRGARLAAKKAQLTREWRELEARVGRTVTESEVS